MSRRTDPDSKTPSALVGRAESCAVVRPVVVVGALITLMRLMFSERARKELEVTAVQLRAAVNEVDARLARISAERSGHRVRLRSVPSSSPREVKPDCKGQPQAANDDEGLEEKQ